MSFRNLRSKDRFKSSSKIAVIKAELRDGDEVNDEDAKEDANDETSG